MANASKKGRGMGSGTVGHQHVGTTDPSVPDEHDLAKEMRGSNRVPGADQARVRNQRLTQPASPDEDIKPPDDPFAPDKAASTGGSRRDRS